MLWNFWRAEWRTASRQRSYYSILVLWTGVISLLLLLERTNGAISGYTNITGTVVNIMLYILPLFMLIYGAFSIANEKENGQWRLLSTYPVDLPSFFFGKLGGQFTAQTAVFSLSYWISMIIGMGTGIDITVKWMLILYLFSIMLIFVFLVIGLFIGAIVNTRWQALTAAVSVWFILIMIWPVALISILGLLPYGLIGPLMKVALFLNPAEFLRFFLAVKLGAGSIFGQSYDGLIPLFETGIGYGMLYFYAFAFLALFSSLSIAVLKRRRVL